ncbi:MAG: cbb3-type cytochrome c oxidase subunit I [Gammaproteobacteria bacterium]|nr:cbb3-type cytochrome c oxidase subunit I [Gammaproteobacteria bacterium]
MSTAINAIERVPFFGGMFRMESNELNPVNVWPSLISMTAFIWFAIAAVIGLSMPAIQFMDLGANWYYQNITLHGAAMTFPFAFQLMVGMSLHRAGACLGKRADDIFVKLFYICMNLGALLLTLAVLGGFHVTYTVMFPLPVVGANMGQWSMGTLILGFTGIALVLTSMIVLYPVKILKMSFFEKTDENLQVAVRTLKDPGMVGMIMGVLVLLVTGTPLMIVAGSLLMHLYGIFPAEWVGWAANPVVFEFVFYIFAHNLMEAMAIMIIGAVYATLPLCTADGSRKLYSDKIALLALWILLITSITSFFHHFFTMYPALPSTLAYHGNIMSYATGVGAALTIFTILATIWKHGIIASPALFLILGGFVMYILDGASAIVISNVAWNFQLHGTLWAGGHAMVVLIAISALWMGMLYYHYPLMTNRTIDDNLARSSIKYLFISYIGLFYTFMAAGAAGVPRRNGDWDGDWMIYGVFIAVFGIMMIYAFVLYFLSLYRSKPIDY